MPGFQIIPHPAIKTDDLPLIRTVLGEQEYETFKDCFAKEIALIQKNGNRNGSSGCEYEPLLAYRKKKFFSHVSPPLNTHPNMRMVYKLDEATNRLFILGVGVRLNERPISPLDIYQRLRGRDQAILPMKQ